MKYLINKLIDNIVKFNKVDYSFSLEPVFYGVFNRVGIVLFLIKDLKFNQ